MSREAKHTPGPLSLGSYGEVLTAKGERLLLSGVALNTGSPSGEAEANALRLVAAWNAFDDVSTERIAAVSDAILVFTKALGREGDRVT